MNSSLASRLVQVAALASVKTTMQRRKLWLTWTSILATNLATNLAMVPDYSLVRCSAADWVAGDQPLIELIAAAVEPITLGWSSYCNLGAVQLFRGPARAQSAGPFGWPQCEAGGALARGEGRGDRGARWPPSSWGPEHSRGLVCGMCGYHSQATHSWVSGRVLLLPLARILERR